MKTLRKVHTAKETVSVDGNVVFRYEGEDGFAGFARALYRDRAMAYPKFYKMSDMCKLGFLTAEVLLQDHKLPADPGRTAIVLACRSASLQADSLYQESMAEIPSPALFVYTLPNIVTGELCIRHKIQGEELMWIQEDYNEPFLRSYADLLLQGGTVDCCLCGWIDFAPDGEYLASLNLLEREVL
ncbi:3-oxoacyl-ACP synthase [Geofilum rhodophaeum]|uniref:3-oxoacyl-ACP synthase n=1 Tax=Geofilum rhodophaeum TaxID=1965019 RepID=UPI0011BAB230|nr:3-oxoacyl-ACP synthase [Geofilum rhodophaeum]